MANFRGVGNSGSEAQYLCWAFIGKLDILSTPFLSHHYIKVFYIQKKQRLLVGAAVFCKLMLDVWHEGHESCALYRCSEVSLSLSSEAGATTIHHASVWVDVSTQSNDIFVVDMVVGR